DEANNAWLLERLAGVPAGRRGARYACVLALVENARTVLVAGHVAGRIAERGRGGNGFGYDPLFEVEGLGCTFGELPSARKAELSHRADAARRLIPWLAGRGDGEDAGDAPDGGPADGGSADAEPAGGPRP
ncbi:MAG: non-canonical purine NTP pyrophosphatase, partial [Gemmatimonadota bacterium]|nr:non-canonical purine NTP pyrophosphatase [Gemmatimonadota bacterium]